MFLLEKQRKPDLKKKNIFPRENKENLRKPKKQRKPKKNRFPTEICFLRETKKT